MEINTADILPISQKPLHFATETSCMGTLKSTTIRKAGIIVRSVSP